MFLASGDNLSKLSLCLLPAAPTDTWRSVHQNERLANGPPCWISAPKSNWGKEYIGKDARLSGDFVAVEELKMYRQVQHTPFFRWLCILLHVPVFRYQGLHMMQLFR